MALISHATSRRPHDADYIPALFVLDYRLSIRPLISLSLCLRYHVILQGFDD